MNSEKAEVYSLNELEFINGKLWANIFQSNSVAVIDPKTGFVEAYKFRNFV
jgi:glutamine cyclotransferase